MLERGVSRIDGDLRQDGRAVDAETAAVELFADHVLQIVADVALAHGHAHGKRHDVALGLLLVVGRERVLDHADLRAVAVGDDELVALRDEVDDGLCGLGDEGELLVGGVAEGVAAEGDDDSFAHDDYLSLIF